MSAARTRGRPIAGRCRRPRSCSLTARSSPTARRPMVSTPPRGTRSGEVQGSLGAHRRQRPQRSVLGQPRLGADAEARSSTCRPAIYAYDNDHARRTSPVRDHSHVRRVEHLHERAGTASCPFPRSRRTCADQRLPRQQVHEPHRAGSLRSRVLQRERDAGSSRWRATTSSSSGRGSSGSATPSTAGAQLADDHDELEHGASRRPTAARCAARTGTTR